jgi:hypothetical protein
MLTRYFFNILSLLFQEKKDSDLRVLGTKVARKMRGNVYVGQVDSYNQETQMYLCSFENGKKLRLKEEAFHEGVYVLFFVDCLFFSSKS